MLKKYKARLNRREFVNYPGYYSAGYILAYVEDTTDRSIGEDFSYDDITPRILLEVGDCANVAKFELDMNSENERANTLHKIDTMIDVLTEMREAVAAEVELVAEREPRIEAIQKRVDKLFAGKDDDTLETTFSTTKKHKFYEKVEATTLDELEDYVTELEAILED